MMGFIVWLLRGLALRTDPSPEVSREIAELKCRARETSENSAAAAKKMTDYALANAMKSENLSNDIRRSVGDVVRSMQKRDDH